MSTHQKCEECGKKFSADTGREYVQLIGGGYADVCDDCAERLTGHRPEKDDE